GIHQYGDLHLTAREAKASGLISDVNDFAPPRGAPLRNI
ncbi:MAG: peptidase S14, partial [Oxalobacteraceae bacterium]